MFSARRTFQKILVSMFDLFFIVDENIHVVYRRRNSTLILFTAQTVGSIVHRNQVGLFTGFGYYIANKFAICESLR